jgi:hypothetical protein
VCPKKIPGWRGFLLSDRQPARLGRWNDVHDFAALYAFGHELHLTVHQREQCVVFADANVYTGMYLRPTLADDDAAGKDRFSAVGFDAETLGLRIATIAGAAACFLMCHCRVILFVASVSRRCRRS